MKLNRAFNTAHGVDGLDYHHFRAFDPDGFRGFQEHLHLLQTATEEAKVNRHNIYIAWIVLANAFG